MGKILKFDINVKARKVDKDKLINALYEVIEELKEERDKLITTIQNLLKSNE